MSVIEKLAGRLAAPLLLVLVLGSIVAAPRPAFAMQPETQAGGRSAAAAKPVWSCPTSRRSIFAASTAARS